MAARSLLGLNIRYYKQAKRSVTLVGYNVSFAAFHTHTVAFKTRLHIPAPAGRCSLLTAPYVRSKLMPSTKPRSRPFPQKAFLSACPRAGVRDS